jgi:hypothetical protein
MQINQTRFRQIVQQALRNAEGHARWVSAIKAADSELSNNPLCAYDGETLLILSTTSETLYEVGQTCQCTAASFGHPCRHRAMRRLVQLYVVAEQQQAQQWAARENAPYYQPPQCGTRLEGMDV